MIAPPKRATSKNVEFGVVLLDRSVPWLLVYGLLARHADAFFHRHFHHHIHLVDLTNRTHCRGTLSPMRPLISEFQIPISYVLENMHVISDSQLMVVTVDRSTHNIPLSSSYQSDFEAI